VFERVFGLLKPVVSRDVFRARHVAFHVTSGCLVCIERTGGQNTARCVVTEGVELRLLLQHAVIF